jgi:hypothetical protein
MDAYRAKNLFFGAQNLAQTASNSMRLEIEGRLLQSILHIPRNLGMLTTVIQVCSA